jgi:hypothetical protein
MRSRTGSLLVALLTLFPGHTSPRPETDSTLLPYFSVITTPSQAKIRIHIPVEIQGLKVDIYDAEGKFIGQQYSPKSFVDDPNFSQKKTYCLYDTDTGSPIETKSAKFLSAEKIRARHSKEGRFFTKDDIDYELRK